MLRDLFSLFPAYAGVILSRYLRLLSIGTFPRIRGGDPIRLSFAPLITLLFPAYAGVIPTCEPSLHANSSFPRIRGGDPPSVPAWIFG